MGEIRSERPSCKEFFIISQLAAIKSGVDRLQATNDSRLVLTGQSLEVNRQVLETSRQVLEAIRTMGKPTAPPSGLMMKLSKARAWANDVLLLHKLFVAWRAVSLPAAGYTLARWLGWL